MSKETIIALHAEHQGRWKNREEIAERMIALLGQLYREKISWFQYLVVL